MDFLKRRSGVGEMFCLREDEFERKGNYKFIHDIFTTMCKEGPEGRILFPFSSTNFD